MNPARELTKIFEGWTTDPTTQSRESPASARTRYAKELGLPPYEVTLRAMQAMSALARRLDELQRAGVYDSAVLRAGFPAWVSAITNAQVSNSAAGQAIPPVKQEYMDNLRMLASVLDGYAHSLLPPPANLDRILAALRDAEADVEQLDINDSLRHHLLSLLARIREAAQSGAPGEFFSASAEFVGATQFFEAATMDAGQKSRWATLRDRVVLPILTNASGSLLTAGVLMIAS